MNRPVIGAIHGWAMHGGLFADLLQAWSQDAVPDWRRLDLPGHGLRRDTAWPSDPDALAEVVVDGLPTGSWLVGWSLGGQVALQAALAEPGRYRGLVLIAATPCFVRRDHWPHGMDPQLLAEMAEALVADPESVIRRFLALEVHGAADAADELRRLRQMAGVHGMPDAAALAAGLDFLADTDLSARLAALDLPVLVIGGRRDRVVAWAALEETVRRLPRACLVRIPGAAHAPFLTRPREVAEAIGGFIHDA